MEEVDSLGEDFLDAETLENSVPYLSAVIKESLRLYPPAYLLVREPMEQQEFGGNLVLLNESENIEGLHFRSLV